ncbi:hypothetical protein SNEBB_001229 [Seison nebaliae]|nr:hypothetical protein SNEBB_001229 [Seison nebaliae]
MGRISLPCFLQSFISLIIILQIIHLLSIVLGDETEKKLGMIHKQIHLKLKIEKSPNQSLLECPPISQSIHLMSVGNGIPTIDDIEKNERFYLRTGGRFWPKDCEQKRPIAIIVCYRNREEHLRKFLGFIHPFLRRQNANYIIIVVEQNNGNSFNRGMLFNIGFLEVVRSTNNIDCFIFHDVDLLPENANLPYRCGSLPIHLANAMSKFKYRMPYPRFAGGVTVFSGSQYYQINGHSNEFWGYGGEDDELALRMKELSTHNFFRYPPQQSRMTMIKHDRNTFIENKYDMLTGVRKRFRYEGLNSIVYDIISIDYFKFSSNSTTMKIKLKIIIAVVSSIVLIKYFFNLSTTVNNDKYEENPNEHLILIVNPSNLPYMDDVLGESFRKIQWFRSHHKDDKLINTQVLHDRKHDRSTTIIVLKPDEEMSNNLKISGIELNFEKIKVRAISHPINYLDAFASENNVNIQQLYKKLEDFKILPKEIHHGKQIPFAINDDEMKNFYESSNKIRNIQTVSLIGRTVDHTIVHNREIWVKRFSVIDEETATFCVRELIEFTFLIYANQYNINYYTFTFLKTKLSKFYDHKKERYSIEMKETLTWWMKFDHTLFYAAYRRLQGESLDFYKFDDVVQYLKHHKDLDEYSFNSENPIISSVLKFRTINKFVNYLCLEQSDKYGTSSLCVGHKISRDNHRRNKRCDFENFVKIILKIIDGNAQSTQQELNIVLKMDESILKHPCLLQN